MKRIYTILFSLILVLTLPQCGVYSFTGASIDPSVKSISIHTLTNQSSLIVPTLVPQLTQAIRDKFTTSTNLAQPDNNGDLDLSGAITSTTVTSAANIANQTAALNQLTVTVTIDFKNRKNEKQNWTQSFTRYSTFASNKSLSAAQDQLIADIDQQLVEDIFNKAVVNW